MPNTDQSTPPLTRRAMDRGTPEYNICFPPIGSGERTAYEQAEHAGTNITKTAAKKARKAQREEERNRIHPAATGKPSEQGSRCEAPPIAAETNGPDVHMNPPVNVSDVLNVCEEHSVLTEKSVELPQQLPKDAILSPSSTPIRPHGNTSAFTVVPLRPGREPVNRQLDFESFAKKTDSKQPEHGFIMKALISLMRVVKPLIDLLVRLRNWVFNKYTQLAKFTGSDSGTTPLPASGIPSTAAHSMVNKTFRESTAGSRLRGTS